MPAARRRELLAVVALTTVAAALRFATLDVQGFWFDESVTVGLLRLGFSDMLEAVPRSESTPPLYYVLAWVWTRPFGTGEVGLRSFSALCGTMTVPLAWAVARELTTRRAALWVAALAAVHPLLVWYSQEARAYALLVLLGAATLWLFARLLRAPHGRDAALWALVAGLALVTHYFALFLVAPQAVWLLVKLPRRLGIPAVGAVGLVGAAVLPLALRQERSELAGYIDEDSLAGRLAQVVKQLALGFDSPVEPVSAGLAAGILLAGVALAIRTRATAQPGLRALGTVGIAIVLLPILAALLGADYVLTRNLILACLPLMIVASAGLTSTAGGRFGPAALAAVSILAMVSSVGVAITPEWQREDWRGAAAAIGPPAARAVLVTEPSQAPALELYGPRLREAGRKALRVDEVVALARRGKGLGDAVPTPPDPATLAALGLRIVERKREPSYELVRMAAVGGSLSAGPDQLKLLGLDRARRPSIVLFEPGPAKPGGLDRPGE